MDENALLALCLVSGAGAGFLLERFAARLSEGMPGLGPRTVVCSLATALLCPFLFVTFDTVAELAVAAALLCVLLVAALTDLQTRRIPNALSGGGLLLIFALAALFEPSSVPKRLFYALIVFTFLLAAALLRPGGIGLGDVKLVAVIGAALGAASIGAIGLGLLAGAAAGASIAICHGWAHARSATLPLAPFLGLSSLAILLLSG